MNHTEHYMNKNKRLESINRDLILHVGVKTKDAIFYNSISDKTLLFDDELSAFRAREYFMPNNPEKEGILLTSGWSASLNCYYVAIEKNGYHTGIRKFNFKKEKTDE